MKSITNEWFGSKNSDEFFKKLEKLRVMEEQINDQKPIHPEKSIKFQMKQPRGFLTFQLENRAFNTANYCQTVEGSERWTLYGLINEMKLLKNMEYNSTTDNCLKKMDYILKGLQNAIDAGEDITKLI